MQFGTETAVFVLLVIVSYFLGNISPATIAGKLGGIDIRQEGSGNPGTTNVLRTLGKKAAAATLAVDVLKGVVPVLLGRYISGELCAYFCGTAALLGHMFPVIYKFKGGKGIATGFGALLALDWRTGLLCLLSCVIFTLLTKRMSVGSIAAAVSLPVYHCLFRGIELLPWSAAVALLLIWKHRDNIKRLIKGEEPKLGFLEKKT